MSTPVCLIVNPSAGGGKAGRVLGDVLVALDGHGLQVRSELTRDLAHARELARKACLAGETVVCLSGDGMVGAVADVLREFPGALLGVLPGGRGNDLARVLGIPADPVEACAIVAAGFSRKLDLGEVDSHMETSHGAHPDGHTLKDAGRQAGRTGGTGRRDRQAGGTAFVGIASVGFDSDANRIANEAPAWLGGLVYAYGALRALLFWRPARFQIELEPPGELHSFTGYSVGAANSKTYGGGMRAAPDALLDDGLLDVPVLENVSKLGFLTKILPKVFNGTHVREPSVKVFRAREIIISADRPFTMYADGDPIGELPLRVRAIGGAVRVLVPTDGSGADAFLATGAASDAAQAER